MAAPEPGRAGYLPFCDYQTWYRVVGGLGEPTLLDLASLKRGRADGDWAIRVNRTVEPDV